MISRKGSRGPERRGDASSGVAGPRQGAHAPVRSGGRETPAGRERARRQRPRRTASAVTGRRRGGRAGLPTALLTWGAIAVVVIVVIVVIVATDVGRSAKTAPSPSVRYVPEPVPASILREITHVFAASYDRVGIDGVTAPTVVHTLPLLDLTGKPGVFVLDGEFCPYCAAECWAVITSLSRFGTFTGLKTMQSSPIDAHPRTQTFEFATTTYTSGFITAKLLERYGQEMPTGRRPVLRKPSSVETELMKKYDANSSVPFFDAGNEIIFSGSSYTPGVLSGLSRATIAADLSHPSSAVARLILGASNYLTAGICDVDGAKPGSVCSSSGVKAAATALGLGA